MTQVPIVRARETEELGIAKGDEYSGRDTRAAAHVEVAVINNFKFGDRIRLRLEKSLLQLRLGVTVQIIQVSQGPGGPS